MSTTWTYDGTSLSSFGKVTLIDNYLDRANARGDNVSIPFRDGTTFVEKFYDQRKVVFGIAIVGDTAADLESKIDTLQTLCSANSQKTLAQTRESGAVRAALASVDTELSTERVSQRIARTVVEFTLTEPFFRSTTLAETTIDVDAASVNDTVTNNGTVKERKPTIVLTGPLSNTLITNTTNSVWVKYTGTIASPRVVTLSVNSTGEWVATDDLAADKIGNITHSGAAAYMVLNVGDNDITITDDTHTTGTVKFQFYPPYF